MLAEGLFGSLLVMATDPAIDVAVTTVGLNWTVIDSDWPGPIVANPPPLSRLYGALGVAGDTLTCSACVWLPLAILNFRVVEVPSLIAPNTSHLCQRGIKGTPSLKRNLPTGALLTTLPSSAGPAVPA